MKTYDGPPTLMGVRTKCHIGEHSGTRKKKRERVPNQPESRRKSLELGHIAYQRIVSVKNT